MKRLNPAKILFIGALAVTPFVLAGCTTTGTNASAEKSAKQARVAKHAGVSVHNGKKTYTYTAQDRECLERAMFFESARSSRSGLVAVGTVVMNRLVSEKYPETICGVVGQKNQFAPGVMTRAMNSKALPDVKEAAQAVLKGERHPTLKNAMFFHTAGLKFPYKNMHYVLVAGGNAFYEKRRKDGSLEAPIPDTPYNLAMAYDAQDQAMPDAVYDVTGSAKAERVPAQILESQPVMVASVHPERFAPTPVAVKSTAAVARAEEVQLAAYQPQASSHMPIPAANPSEHAFTTGAATSQQKVDAIGALLLAQDRPQPAF